MLWTPRRLRSEEVLTSKSEDDVSQCEVKSKWSVSKGVTAVLFSKKLIDEVRVGLGV